MMNWPVEQAYIKKVYAEWEKFITTGVVEDLNVREPIRDSWQRSYDLGIPPQQWAAPIVLDEDELKCEMNNNRDFVEASAPILSELGELLDGTGQLLTLCNSNAVIIKNIGDKIALERGSDVNLIPGACIGESHNGTTGAALVMRNLEPVRILATEHYCSGPKAWACAAAPIFRDQRKNILGILCLSGRYITVNNHSTGLVISAARAIEGRLFEKYLWKNAALMLAYTETVLRYNAELVIALSTSGDIIDASAGYHPALKTQSRCRILVPELSSIVKMMLLNPNSIDSFLENLTLSGNKRYIVTGKSIFKDNSFCGVLLYLYGEGKTYKEPVLNSEKKPQGRKPSGTKEMGHLLGMVGNSPLFQSALEQALQVAQTDASVIILGETGVGKEGLAKGIHKCSHRAKGPFIPVNCGAIPKDLIAGELFGYAPGAFTGASARGNAGKIEAANGGTLFLDELGELPIEMQTYLLRVIQEMEVVRLGSNKPVPVDIRIIAATNRNLQERIKSGAFRDDLYYRLSVIEIKIPALKERLEDIPHLIAHFCNLKGIAISSLGKDTLNLINSYNWPGNVRELMNIIHRAAVLGKDVETVLSEYIRPLVNINKNNSENLSVMTNDDDIVEVLASVDGNVSEAARILGVARSTIYRHLKSKQISIDRNIHLK